ncbi:hypothetical protein N7530_002972 [Penicillium desertorum]|uniref:Uncharacterized protein n=1 Tax=Penicillium desertorum TaxID=1303715 RepID=A0A9W9X4R1_9EURO|nr:hypothetical protein N7530_002972 [Penicillium desertorum]
MSTYHPEDKMQVSPSSGGPSKRSSISSTPSRPMMTDVEELRQHLEKNKKELVEVIEGLIQHTANGDKDAMWGLPLLQWIP